LFIHAALIFNVHDVLAHRAKLDGLSLIPRETTCKASPHSDKAQVASARSGSLSLMKKR
jgi:hypothetical protein